MKKILYITANPMNEEASYSMALGKEFLSTYKEVNPNDEIVHLDLFRENIPQIDADVLSGWGKMGKGVAFNDLFSEEQSKISRLGELSEQFINADKYIFVTPFWNFSYPPVMKAYLDAVSVAGKSFKYTEDGVPVGLLNNKKAVHIQARGGFYSEAPFSDLEMGNRHIQIMMSFFGVPSFEEIVVEGHNKDVDNAESIKKAGIDRAIDSAKNF